MNTKELKRLETVSIDDLKSILKSIGKNKNIISLDYSLMDELLDGLLESILEELQEYLYENFENDLDDDEIMTISELFIQNLNLKGVDFFEPYFENKTNFKNFNRWLFTYSSETVFAHWADFNFNLFFSENFELANYKEI